MGLFKANSFLSVIKSVDECKFFFRKISFSKKVVDEKSSKLECDENTDLRAALAEVAPTKDKGLVANVMIDTCEQKVFFSDDYERSESMFYQTVDSDFTVEFPLSETTKCDEQFGVSFNSYESIFKVLYFLYKNQHDIDRVAMFAIKFNDKVAFIVANHEHALYADIVEIDDEIKATMSDDDELFYGILNYQVDNFYKSENSEFLTNIFIYSDGSLSNEIGYVIFTKIHIKTNLINLNFADFINKISMLESRQ